MYSPVKASSKDDERNQIKEKKRMQLVVLLTNKFRNKFSVNNVTEPAIDLVIRQEIQKLLKDGQTYESNLNQLDKKLEVIIKEARKTRNPQPVAADARDHPYRQSNQSHHSSIQLDSRNSGRPAGSNYAPSERGSRSQRGSKGMENLSRAGAHVMGGQGQQVRDINGSKLVYEDPALALNLNDDQWNDIVQKNYQAFENEKKQAILSKKQKNMAVYAQQQEQIKARALRESMEKKKDKDYFQKVGFSSSDVYYKNEDARKDAAQRRKGQSHSVAIQLRQQHQDRGNQQKQTMQQQAEERRAQQQKFNEEDIRNKEIKVQKKADLRKVQEIDSELKNQAKNQMSSLDKGTHDFADHNVFTYVYSQKIHKSHALREQNEKRISNIKKQYGEVEGQKHSIHLSSVFEKDQQKMSDAKQREMQERLDTRKKLEHQAKLFQDRQTQEKQDIKKAEIGQKKKDQEIVNLKVEEFKKQDQEAKANRITKNKNHLKLVMDQMNVESKNVFAKTGVAVIKA